MERKIVFDSRLLHLFALSIFLAPFAHAGTPKSVHVFSEEVDAEGKSCGLSEATVIAAAAYPLQESGFELIPESRMAAADFLAYINVTVSVLPTGQCSGDVRVSFKVFAPAMLPWKETLSTEDISLCEKGSTFTFAARDASDKILKIVEDATKRCIVKLKTADS